MDKTTVNNITDEQEIERINCIIGQRNTIIDDLYKQIEILERDNKEDIRLIKDLRNKILHRPTSI